MKTIHESVAMGVLAVSELKDLIHDERNEEKRETLEGARYAYYYLIANLIKQFGISRFDIQGALVDLGHTYREAHFVLIDYEKWACHVVKKDEYGDNT